MRVLLALLVAAQNPVVPPPPSPTPDTAHLVIVATDQVVLVDGHSYTVAVSDFLTAGGAGGAR